MWPSNQYDSGAGGGGGVSMNMGDFNYGSNMMQGGGDSQWNGSAGMGGQQQMMMGGNQMGGMNPQTSQQMGYYSNSGGMGSQQDNSGFDSTMQGHSPGMAGGNMGGGTYNNGGSMRFGQGNQQMPGHPSSGGYVNAMSGMKPAAVQQPRPRMPQGQVMMDANSPGYSNVGGNMPPNMYQQRQQMQSMMSQGQQQITPTMTGNFMAGNSQMAAGRGVGSPNMSGGGSSGNMVQASPTGGALSHQQSPAMSSVPGNSLNQLQGNPNMNSMAAMNSMKMQQQQQQQQLASRANAMYGGNQFGGPGMRPAPGQLSGPGGQMMSNPGSGGPRMGGAMLENYHNQQQAMAGYGNPPGTTSIVGMSRDGSGAPMMSGGNMQQGGMRVNNMAMASDSIGNMNSPNAPSVMNSQMNSMQYQQADPGYQQQQRQRMAAAAGGGGGMVMGAGPGMMRSNPAQQVSMGGMPNSMQRQQALQRMGIDSSGANMASMMQQGGYQGTASNPMSGMGPQQGMMGNMGMQGMAMQGMGMQGRAMQGMGMGMGGGQSMSGPMARNMGGMMPSGGFLGKRGRMDEIRERRMAQGGQPLLKFLGSTAPALNSVGAAPPPGMRITQSFPTQGQHVSNVNRQSPGSQQDRLGQQGGGHFIHSGGSGQQEQGYGTAGQQGPHYSGSEEQQPLNVPQSQGDLPAPQNHEDNEIILVSDEENEERQPAMNEQGETDAAQSAPASSAPIAEGSRNVPEGRNNHDGSGASAGPAESVIPAHQHEAPELVNDSQILADEGAEQAGVEARASEGPQAEMPSEGAAVVDDNASAVSDTAKPTDIGPEDPTAQQPGPIAATATPSTMPTSPNAAAQTIEVKRSAAGGPTANVDTLAALAVAGGFRKSPKFSSQSTANTTVSAAEGASYFQPPEVPVSQAGADAEWPGDPQASAMMSTNKNASPHHYEMPHVGNFATGIAATISPSLPRASTLPANGVDHVIMMEAGAAVHSEMMASNAGGGADGGFMYNGGGHSNGFDMSSWPAD